MRIFGRNREGLCLAYLPVSDRACSRARWHDGDHRFFVNGEATTAEERAWMFNPEDLHNPWMWS